MIKIGIAYEGSNDVEIIPKFISKIVSGINVEYEITKMIPANTGIIGFIKPYTRQLFEKDNVDISVFLTDQDVPCKQDDRRRHIVEEIEKVNPGYLDFSAIGVADPHIEQWLMADENVLKKIFSLTPTVPLPHADQVAKQRLKSLWSQMPTPKSSMYETLLAIADATDVDYINEKYPDFRLFSADLRKIVLSSIQRKKLN